MLKMGSKITDCFLINKTFWQYFAFCPSIFLSGMLPSTPSKTLIHPMATFDTLSKEDKYEKEDTYIYYSMPDNVMHGMYPQVVQAIHP